ncbi:MAG: 30S ribosomal protein S9 [Puniceicoccales bacterium]|jgi:small subunit ribosomal protein S9|nr:30S ribosomal protein S9 [Puniceicoccales bacterium]
MNSNEFSGVGRRKSAVARVRIKPGNGRCFVNDREVDFSQLSDSANTLFTKPLKVTQMEGKLDLFVRVAGGGEVGQMGAISMGLSRAIEKMNGELRAPLKEAGLLTRDSRVRERKKPGRPGARKRFQFSKR